MALNHSNANNNACGQLLPTVQVPQEPIVANRAPTVNDKALLGQEWVYPATNSIYFLASIVNNSSTWVNVGGGAGIFTSITVHPGPFTFTGTGAFTVNTTGAILMDSTSNSHLTVTGANLLVESVNGNLTLESNGLGTTATLEANGAGSAVDITSNTGGTTITSTGVININSDDTGVNAIIINANDPGNAGDILMTTSGGQIELSTQGEGNIFLQAVEVTTAGAAGNAGFAFMGVMTQTGLVTAAGASQVITITTTAVTAASGILVSAANKGANNAQMTVTRVVPAAGSFTVTVTNNGAAALNGDLIISFMIISQ